MNALVLMPDCFKIDVDAYILSAAKMYPHGLSFLAI